MVPSKKSELIELLRTRAYREGQFVLSSGTKSNCYLDAKQVTYDPRGLELVSDAFLQVIRRYEANAVGGMTMGADAIVAGVVLRSASTESPIPGFLIRKEPKGHGLEKWIEGVLEEGWRVAIVDDVVTSGRSLLTSIDRVQDEGCEVVVAMGLVDRLSGGQKAMEDRGIPYHPITTIEEVREPRSSPSFRETLLR